jgi:hypothetical protein
MFTGSIGKYAIEMEIPHIDKTKSTFDGRYRYLSQKEYLTIHGEFYDDCLYIIEFTKSDTTGEFYLQFDGDSLKGYWTHESKWFPVRMKVKSGSGKALQDKPLKEFASSTSTAINGSYGSGGAFLNDYWFQDENPQLELGFNGGYAVLETLGNDSLRFQVEMICGPTYHFATAEGIAFKKGDVYIYQGSGEWDAACEIRITIGERSIHIAANGSMECGFGARAYLDDDFVKITDKVLFGTDVSLGKIKEEAE